MNKKGLTDRDILNWIKIIATAIIGFLIIRALWSAV